MKFPKKPLASCFLSLALALGASAQVNITTWQVNLQHTGANLNETTLTPASIATAGNFGLLFAAGPMDGQIYGQPLYVSNLTINGGVHNVVYLVTQRGFIYAYDADSNTGANANPLWSKSILAPGGVFVPQGEINSGDISDALSITATPVIDLSTQTIYVLVKSKIGVGGTTNSYIQHLHALDLVTGAEKFGGPVEIKVTFAGGSNFNGIENSGSGTFPFNPWREHARSALALYNGIVYLSYASHSDTDPYHGEVIGYDATTLQLVKSFVTSPNSGTKAGIWAGGASPAVDTQGNMYLTTGNGPFDQNTGPGFSGTDWGMSFLKLPTTGTFTVNYNNPLNWFTPNAWQTLNNGDTDIGSSGVILLPDQSGGTHTHILAGGGKGGTLYVLDRDSMGGLATPDNAIQEIQEPGQKSLFVTPAYYNGYIYYAPAGGPMEQRTVGYNPATGTYISDPPVKSNFIYNGGHGSHAFVSANGNTNGIVWTLDLGTPCKLHAYNANSVAGDPIYIGSATSGGVTGTGRKFCVPIVANGKVYFTADNAATNGSYLWVFGPPPPAAGSPAAPTNLSASANTSGQITLNWTDNSNNEVSFKIKRSTSAAGPFTALPTSANSNDTSYIDTGLTASTTYYYQVVASNAIGDSNPTLTASATTFPTYSENGLVAYWNLDELGGGIAADITGNGHTGTWVGEQTPLAGLVNSGHWFHGTGTAFSYIGVPNSPALQFAANQSFTIAAWVHPEAVHNSVYEAVLTKSADQGNFYSVAITPNPENKWVFRGPGGDVLGSTSAVNTWTHITAVQDGPNNTRKLYVNGVLVGSGPAQAANGAGDLWIAQSNPGTGIGADSFPGTIDEVRIYNRALDVSEIPALMGPPVLQAVSSIVHGTAGTFKQVLVPSTTKVIESRKGSPVGSYSLALSFSAPVSGITASLTLQGGGSAVGTLGTLAYDATGKIVTVPLTGVGNAQSLNLHLTGIQPGNGTADIPFNVLWGDVNDDNVVDALDLNIVQGNRGATLTAANAGLDINCDGTIGAGDEVLAAAGIGTNIGAQTASNIALFKPATATSTTGAQTPNLAFDGNTTLTRWESLYTDPQTLTVDLGTVSTINSFGLWWEHSSGKTYTIDVSTNGTSWTTAATELNCPAGPVTKTYTSSVPTGRYVRMAGTTRTTAFGYSPFEFQVFGIPGAGAGGALPAITSGTAATASQNSQFSYQVTATNSPSSYNAAGLPAGLTINNSSGIISGTPTAQGTSNVTISAINAYGSGSATLVITVEAPPTTPPTITSPLTATATLLSPFSYQVTATKNPYGYAATGLPDGLSLNPITGLITGSSNAAGTYNVGLTATNSIGTSTTATLVLTISGGGNINLSRLAGVIAEESSTHIGGSGPAMAIDGDITTRWESAYSDPQTITLTLPQVCSISFVILNWQNAAGKAYTIETSMDKVNWAPIVTETNNSTIGYKSYPNFNTVAKYVRLVGTARTTPYGYSLFEFQLWGVTGAVGFAPVVSSPLTATATTGTPFSYQIAGTNTPTSFNATGLPSWASVDANGLITGTPPSTAGSPYNVSISATNSLGTDTKTLVLTVNVPNTNPPAISSPLTASGSVGTAFSYQITAANNPTSFNATGLPSWASINSNGLITGTPTSIAGTPFSISISATNAFGTDTKTLVLNIAAYVDVNLALNKTVEVSSVENAGTPGNLAVDGNTGTRWSSTAAIDPGYIIVDLGQTCTVHSVNLNWEAAAGKDYKLQISADKVNWTDLTAPIVGNTTIGAINYPGMNGVGRYVQMIGTARVSPYGYSLWEFAVMGVVGGGGPAPVITSSLTATATVGASFAYQIAASNSPTTFNASGLPNGLSVNASGLISGTPTVDGTTNVSISASSVNGTDTKTLVLTVNPAAAGVPVITSALTKSGSVGAALSYQIAATNTPTSYTATSLPAGLSIKASTGLISGTPTVSGTFTVPISATNATATAHATLIFTIAPPIAPPVINSSASKPGNLGTALTYQITATNNPTGFSATGLPAGLSVSPTTGAITGTPTAAGTTKATIKATNSSGTGSAYLTFVIASGPELNLSLGQPSSASSFQDGNLVANGNDASTAVNTTRWAAGDGTFPQSWKVDLGGNKIVSRVDITWFNNTTRAYKYLLETSPDDTTYTTVLDQSNNAVSGQSPGTLATPVMARWIRVTVTGSSNGGNASFWDCSVFGTSAPTPPAITSALTASGTAGSAFNYQITANNTTTSFSATGLPAGLMLNPATGVISGIPTAAATTNVTLSATNTGGTGATSTLVLTVSPGTTSVLMSAVSRLTQGSAGALDLTLPAGGTPATEVRSGSVAGAYSLVLTFSAPVSGVTATLQRQAGQSGSPVGSVGALSYSGSTVTVPLTGVANAQRLNLHLTGIQPGNGTVDIPFNLLTGDVNRDNTVNALDIGQVKTRSGQTVDQTTMSYDVNSDGAINAADQTATKSWSGASLP